MVTAAYLKGTESALFCEPWKSTFSEIIAALRLALLLLADMEGWEGGKERKHLLPILMRLPVSSHFFLLFSFLSISQLHRILSFIVISLHTHITHVI